MANTEKAKRDPPSQEPDQLHVYEALSNHEAFELTKLSFEHDTHKLNKSMSVGSGKPVVHYPCPIQDWRRSAGSRKPGRSSN